MGNGDYVGDPYGCAKSANSTEQWRQREWNCEGDAEGVKEQLQGIKRVPFLLDDNVGATESVVSPCAEPAELGLNENSCENDDNCG